MKQSLFSKRIPVIVLAVTLIVMGGCGSNDDGEVFRGTAAEIALATAQAETRASITKGTGDHSAVDVLRRAAEISATLDSFRFTTETVVTSGDEVMVSGIHGEWTQPGRYRGISENSDDPVAEFIVADGQLIYLDRESNQWRLDTEYDQALGIASGQLIPNMDEFEFSDPSAPDDGEFYRITGMEQILIEGFDVPLAQMHELVIRVADFHVETVTSSIKPDARIGHGGTQRRVIIFDRNVPDQIVLPEIVLSPQNSE